MTGSYTLHQYGDNPCGCRFLDAENRLAFTVEEVDRDPNLVVRIVREPEWSQQHPSIMGPSMSFLYFGPSQTPGYLVYGNGGQQSMLDSLVKGKRGSNVKSFITQRGDHCKWKVTPRRFECVDGKGTTMAVWEVSPPDTKYYARLTIHEAGLPVVTELQTTLILNVLALTRVW